MNKPTHPFSLFIKAEGAQCNLDCSYCYYLNRQDGEKRSSMPVAMMEKIVDEHIESQPLSGQNVDFIWHGGEPMLRGLEFYEAAVSVQAKKVTNKRVVNTMQTNGTMINERWASFFAKHNFMLGISIDGPNLLNDIARIDKNGQSSFERTMRGMRHLKNSGVEFNTLTVVNNKTYQHAKTIYQFLVENGSGYMQFQPCIDHELDRRTGHDWSLSGEQWGQFLCDLFDEWVESDVGKVYIQFFENCLMVLMGYPSQMCHHSETCGQQLMVEHDGNVYSCDHYGYQDHQLGSIANDKLMAMATSQKQIEFGTSKYHDLNEICRRCDFVQLCQGGCPKNRIATTKDGAAMNHLCRGYEMFFHHALPKLIPMVGAMKKGYSPAYFPLF
ncbi:anaerobic sulfatase maturase [Vibrio methylphosphonaticus]|uniref:anaerobic sulfatase maturase n=1 Tax=Vibrio methylphosphonaticus TaxID=2946866 RepID=UPI002029C31E|nr:anaerobic sulfatase maturase [Vibrio methylphosphonaticus]MCL9774803.1 anaerobic sulfatase maturase [Vibrio methylphosphonaticus]